MPLPPCKCPHCGKSFHSSALLAGGAAPVQGNWTICTGCAEPLRFTETLSIRALNGTERERLEASPEYPKFRELIDLLKRCFPSKKPRVH